MTLCKKDSPAETTPPPTDSVSAVRVAITRFEGGEVHPVDDMLAAEEPLEIRLSYRHANAIERRSLAITMRTPGHDKELAVGFLFGEGIIRRARIWEVSAFVGRQASNRALWVRAMLYMWGCGLR